LQCFINSHSFSHLLTVSRNRLKYSILTIPIAL
jgi:hypothetical protein